MGIFLSCLGFASHCDNYDRCDYINNCCNNNNCCENPKTVYVVDNYTRPPPYNPHYYGRY